MVLARARVVVMMQSALIRMQKSFPAATTSRARFDGVLSKLAAMVGIATLSGVLGWQFPAPGLYLVAMVLGFGLGLAGSYRPHLAQKVAPFYAVAMGFVLGGVSSAYSNVAHGIVPTAIVATSAIFMGCFALHKTGLVKVTPRFMQITGVATFAFVIVIFASLLGMPIPGARELGPRGLMFGVIGLGIALMNLFVGFERARKVEEGAMAPEVEWFAALQLMISLVMVYVNVLRIIASSRRR
jgi:uncharacterized YccA/Bax inhibitor family protein